MNEIELPIEKLGLSIHACRLLRSAGYRKAIDVAESGESIRQISGIGVRTCAEIMFALRYHGYNVEVPDC